MDPFESEDEDRTGGLIRAWEITGEEKYRKAADQVLVEELEKPTSASWPFTTAGHFRMVLNTSTGFMYYLSAVPAADSAKLRAAILKAADANRDTYLSSWEDAGSYLPLLLMALACDLSGEAKYAEGLSGLLQRVRLPLKAEVPPDFLQSLTSLPFEKLPEVAIGQWGVNNVYSLELSGFNAVPYITAALARAGLDEAGYLKVARVNTPAPPFEEVLDPRRSVRRGSGRGRTATCSSTAWSMRRRTTG